MADTKITALTANTTPVSTDITVIVDDPAGTPASQKITLANLMALFANPVSNGGDDLGTSSLRWANLFLTNTASIDFDGPILAGGTADFFLSGGMLNLAPGTTGYAPLLFQGGGALMTTPNDGAVEFDGANFYITGDSANRGVLDGVHLIRQDSSRNLTSTISEQQLFNSVANGTLTLETGTYFFSCQFSLSGMSATSGNAAFDILGGGSATLGTVLYNVVGIDGNTNTAATQTGSTSTAAQSPASAVTAGTGTAMQAHIRGTFEVTGAGTIQPAVTLVTAAAATVAAGSYFECKRRGGTSLASVGQWS